MRRWYLYGLIITLLVVTFAWAIYWFFFTTGGARWLFWAVSEWSPVKIEAREVRGKIAGPLHLQKFHVRWPQGEIQGGSFELRWRPFYLLTGKLVTKELIIKRARVQDNASPGKAEPSLSWPRVPAFLTLLAVEIQTLSVEDLVYRRPDRTLFSIDNLSAHLAWQHGLLTIDPLTLTTPSGRADGRVEMGLLRPSLSLDLNLTPAKATLGLNTLSVKIGLQPGRSPEQVTGQAVITGKSLAAEPRRLLRFEGEIGITQNALRLRRLLLSQPGRSGTVTGEGEVIFSGTDPFIRFHLIPTDVDLSPQFPLTTSISGDLKIEGHPSRYRGSFNLSNRKENWRLMGLSGAFEGSLKEIEVSILEGNWIDGIFRGQLKADWGRGLSLSGELQGRNLNPARITPEWQGQVNLDLFGTFQQLPTGGPEGKVDLRLLESHVRGQALTGGCEAHLSKSVLRISRMNLKGKGFDLSAHGVLQERLTFDADISDLSGLVPAARGRLVSRGWLRWKEHHVAGYFESSGKNLLVAGLNVKALDVRGRVDDGKEAAVELRARMDGLAYQSFSLDSAFVNISGRMDHHTVMIHVHWPKREVKSLFEGTYHEGEWHGKIVSLTGTDPMGSWNLQTWVPLNLSSRGLRLESFVITSAKGEKVAVTVDLRWDRLRGSLSAEWNDLNLARLSPLLNRNDLTGLSTGKFRVRWLDEDRFQFNSTVRLTGAYQHGPMTIRVSRAQGNLDWNEAGLQGLFDIDLRENGRVSVTLSSPQPARFAFPEQAIMKAVWENINLKFVRPWLPSSLGLEGSVTGRATGQWSKGKSFDTQGELEISRGMVWWQREEGPMSDSLKKAYLRWSWGGEQLSGDLSLTFSELGALDGSFQLPVIARLPLSLHHTAPIRISLHGNVEEKGLLSVLLPDLIRESKGQVHLNLNSRGTWKNPQLEGNFQFVDSKVHLLTDRRSKKFLMLHLSRGSLSFHWGEKGGSASIMLRFADGGRLNGELSTGEAARMGFPEYGEMKAKWEAFPLELFHSWLPEGFQLEGALSGHLDGQWSPGGRMDTRGALMISRGALNWRMNEGVITAGLQKADIAWVWKDESLRGDLSFSLREYGHIDGSFQLPLNAQLPVVVRPDGPIRISLQGQVQEKGLLSAFLPGAVQESHGQIDLNMNIHGTWQNPSFEGNLQLSKSGAYLPGLGIHVKDLAAQARFAENRLEVTSFHARSGAGHVEGKASVWREGWRVSRFQGKLRGERFQTIYLPELQVLSSPRLDFTGTTEKLTVRGEIGLPEVLISGPQTEDVVRPSADVVIVDPGETPTEGFPLTLDLNVRLIFGEKVLVRAKGIDARLAGDITLRAHDTKTITASGEIRVAQGHYSAYGQKLDITRGRLLFTGGPVDRPTLDILAIRKVRDVQAGVIVTGTPQTPVVKLYSRPAMPDTDILSYIILGQPLGGGKEQIPALMQAAGMLLSAGESAALQSQLKSKLGVDTLDIEAGGDEVARSMVTVGKYLTPKLYISLGRSLVTDATLVTLRYTLSRRWEIETRTGTETGGILYFKVEFD